EAVDHRVRRHRGQRPAVPAAGRGGNALLRDGGRQDGGRSREGRDRRPEGDDPRARLDGADPRAARGPGHGLRPADGRRRVVGGGGGLPARRGLRRQGPCVPVAGRVGSTAGRAGGRAAPGGRVCRGSAGGWASALTPAPSDPAAELTGGVLLVWPGAAGVAPGVVGGGAPGTPTGGTLWRRAPHAAGSVPFTNAIGTTRTHSFDGSRSTGTTTTLSGIGKSSLGLSPSTRPMYVVQIGTATREPVSSLPRLRGRS